MTHGAELARLADRLADAADRCEQLRLEYRSAATALGHHSSGQTISAATERGLRVTEPDGGFYRLAEQVRALAAATARFADAASTSAAEHALIDAAEQRELAAARFQDGDADGAHTMIASAVIAADRKAVDDDLVDAAGESVPVGALSAGALSVGAFAGGAALAAQAVSAAADHSIDDDLREHIQNRLVEFVPLFPMHLPGWRVAVGLCRAADGTDQIVVATPEPAPYLRPGFVLRRDETMVGTGIEPELAMLNYARAQQLSVVAIATTGVDSNTLDVLNDHQVEVTDPLRCVVDESAGDALARGFADD